ncbi:PDZ domain-containing protein [Paenibacillus sp. 481]|uniref:PDZ domain-containing protein n=1 Tax=Paenibacillus sp. 481 TaxID=2835869 RepID=UPI001E478F10|nr:PDZ domain-containing protein [Paenibacillus sp. 481]UHA71634.1 PDZ domain-containing protein [Paenibacillus sp. 481]
MELATEIVYQVAGALLQWLLSPFYWLSMLFIALYYRRQIVMERRLFAVKMRSWIEQTWHTMLGGLIAGLIVSAAVIGLGITFSREIMFVLWGLALLFMLIRVRFLCLAYAAGALALIQMGLNVFAQGWVPEGWMGTAVHAVRTFDAAGLLVLVALLHAAEAWLIRKQAVRFASPLFLESKRGRIVGAYQMQSMWPVPLFMLFPTMTAGTTIPWTPLFGGDVWLQGWSVIAFPIVIGFSELTFTRLPQEKASVSASRLFAYAAVLLALGLAAKFWAPLLPVAAIMAVVLHEGLIWFSRREEIERSPIFTHDGRGLRVLAVLPDSPAAELGIRTGEVIVRANGIQVRTKEQLHQALRANAAFCKLEVLNYAGEVRFLQRALYAGEHHQLGALLAPDNRVSYVAVARQPSLFALLLVAPWRQARNRKAERADEQVAATSEMADSGGVAIVSEVSSLDSSYNSHSSNSLDSSDIPGGMGSSGSRDSLSSPDSLSSSSSEETTQPLPRRGANKGKKQDGGAEVSSSV